MSELGERMGENIRIYRRANRMTLSELAERINKSKATVGKYEQGAIALDMDTLYEIAAALGVSPFQLMVSLLPLWIPVQVVGRLSVSMGCFLKTDTPLSRVISW